MSPELFELAKARADEAGARARRETLERELAGVEATPQLAAGDTPRRSKRRAPTMPRLAQGDAEDVTDLDRERVRRTAERKGDILR